MQSKFTTTFGQNNAKEFLSNSETNEIEKMFLQNVCKVPDQNIYLRFLIKTKNESKQVNSLKYISLTFGEKL